MENTRWAKRAKARKQEAENNAKAFGIGIGSTAGIGGATALANKYLKKDLFTSKSFSIENNPEILEDVLKLKGEMGYKDYIFSPDYNNRTPLLTVANTTQSKKSKLTSEASANKIFSLYGDGAKSLIDAYNKEKSPFYVSTKKADVVVAPLENNYLLAHELGHATGKNYLARGKLPALGRSAAASNLVNTAFLGASYDKDKSLKDQSNFTKANLAATAASSLGAASVLGEEARASIRGAKYLKRIGMGNYKDAAKNLLPGYATYALLMGAAPYGAYKLSGKLRESIVDKKIDKKGKDKIDQEG